MKYLTKFDTQVEYEAYMTGGEVVLPNVSLVEENMSVGYKPYHDYSQDYFTTVVIVGGDITWTGSTTNKLSYSTDNGTTWSTANSSITLSVNEGDKVLWKGTTIPSTSYPNQGIGRFSGGTDVKYSVEGNMMSLRFGDDFSGKTGGIGNYAFSYLFSDNKNLTSAENLSLPATTLAYYCYYGMFKDCTSLTVAPELPETILVEGCYGQMFNGCTSLTTAPELPATTLANSCYYKMFNGCTSLNSIECLATDISAGYCTNDWVNGVAASGTFTKAASMTSWTEGTSGIPSGWNVVDAA